ncbi:Predicted DNA-binding transcriptional regulator YafY, contains an HTH and WYL domains [Paenibacillus sp. cl141a]|uniref:helix-turn-helix transcriptional regulator n=1 Tax=Paenibacillus sp. cl141a TaxID=1761877 RepID=UPI0008AFDCB7|nr:YafY family protein [Paenibacillus sp. cl141a]SEK72768.1 Predicted DNA-binding transcriptional regulator YafY, contains an HTH and WYL domains [Paenibacillus sp. cl141a]
MQKSQRLIQLMMMINAKKSFTVRELADEFGLSVRTISRDLDELSGLGVPIYSVQGRGGGYRLLQERMLPPISFTESEAIAIFFACQSLSYFSTLPFGDGAATALHKFYHYLPADIKEQIERLKDRVMIHSPFRPMSADILQTLMQAVMVRQAVTISYRSSAGSSQRHIQPIGLYASSGYWYCPAYCFTQEDIRQFRVDRMTAASPNESLSIREDIASQTLQDMPGIGDVEMKFFEVELTSKGVWLLETDTRLGSHIHRNTDGSGVVRLEIPATNVNFYADYVWRLGEEAVITSPAEAVLWTQEKIESMRLRYT